MFPLREVTEFSLETFPEVFRVLRVFRSTFVAPLLLVLLFLETVLLLVLLACVLLLRIELLLRPLFEATIVFLLFGLYSLFMKDLPFLS